MTTQHTPALEWALHQDYGSVAARYAKELALLALEQEKTIQEIEVNYPNWRGRFATLAEAIKWHTTSQDTLIANLRSKTSAPDLLAACEEISMGAAIPADPTAELLRLVSIARAAIRKAKGQKEG